jgi:hypothetical protein
MTSTNEIFLDDASYDLDSIFMQPSKVFEVVTTPWTPSLMLNNAPSVANEL